MSEAKSGLNTPVDRSTRFERKRLHLGICGSVACYKATDLLRAWAGMVGSVACVLLIRRFFPRSPAQGEAAANAHPAAGKERHGPGNPHR